MAKKRMFSLGVLETDAFMDMPLSSQALYFHLCLRADDDGFIGNPKRITQSIGASIDDLRMLVAKRFVIAFEDGVIVIKHWRMHNAIKSDRYVKTNYTEELAMLGIKENGAYTLSDSPACALTEHKWSTDGAQMAQTYSADIGLGLGKGKDSTTYGSSKGRFTPPTATEVAEYAQSKGLKIDAERFVNHYTSNGWMVGRVKMKDWKATVRNWCARDKETQTTPQRNPKVQATHGFSSERKDVDYNAMVMQQIRERWSQEDDDG